jgi:hypothetical protein
MELAWREDPQDISIRISGVPSEIRNECKLVDLNLFQPVLPQKCSGRIRGSYTSSFSYEELFLLDIMPISMRKLNRRFRGKRRFQL